MEENIDMCTSDNLVPLSKDIITDHLSPSNYHLMHNDNSTWAKPKQPDKQSTTSVDGNDKPHEDNENVEYSVFNKLEDVEQYIAEQEIAQTTKFILNRICKGFGTPDPDVASQKKQRVKWIASGVKFMGKPFLLIGDKRYDCRHGKDKNVAKKVRYNERRKSMVVSGEQQRINNVRKGGPLKIDCPAKVQVRDILVYTEFSVEGADQGVHELPSLKDPTNSDSYVKHNAQRRLRDRTSARIRGLLERGTVLKTERQFHVSFPKLEAHRGHEVGQAAGTRQRLDRRIIEYIHKLVSEGVIHIDDVKARMETFVAQLFTGKPLPEKDNRRYYPLAKDISNHIQKSMASIMSCRGSAHNLQQLYEKLRKENAGDCLYFRPSVEGSSRLLYLHQTSSQQCLLKENVNSRCTLEVKYRDKKTSLPMFLVYVDVEHGRQTVANFILEAESDLPETIAKLKDNNPLWSPSEWLIEGSTEHLSSLQSLFPDSVIVSKDSQDKTTRRVRKRLTQTVENPAPPRPPGDALRQLLKEFEDVSHNLPSSSDTWAIVSSLGVVLQQAKDLASSASSVVVSQKRPKMTSTVDKRVSTSSGFWQSEPLTSTTHSIEHMTSNEPVHLTDHHGIYVNIHQQPLAQPHYSQPSLGSQQNTNHLPSPSTHNLLGVSHSPGLSLQVAGMLGDGYNLHHSNNAIGSVYTSLPTQQQPRHYVNLQNQQQHESPTFAQHLVKASGQ